MNYPFKSKAFLGLSINLDKKSKKKYDILINCTDNSTYRKSPNWTIDSLHTSSVNCFIYSLQLLFQQHSVFPWKNQPIFASSDSVKERNRFWIIVCQESGFCFLTFCIQRFTITHLFFSLSSQKTDTFQINVDMKYSLYISNSIYIKKGQTSNQLLLFCHSADNNDWHW